MKVIKKKLDNYRRGIIIMKSKRIISNFKTKSKNKDLQKKKWTKHFKENNLDCILFPINQNWKKTIRKLKIKIKQLRA